MTTPPAVPALDRLGSDLTGSMILPTDTGYDEARRVFLSNHDRRPAAVVRVADDDDVRRVVSFAADTGMALAVRSGGHSSAGHGTTDGGIVLDLTDLTALDIDVAGRTAWAQTGLTAGAYIAATAEHGLGTGFGDTADVGIGGLTTAGGIGFLVRKHGLTIDSLLAAEVVTADGALVRTDAETEPDLFWAIRGGGGNFGVATRFRYRLHDLETSHRRDAGAARHRRRGLRVPRRRRRGPRGGVNHPQRDDRTTDAVPARGAPREARGARLPVPLGATGCR